MSSLFCSPFNGASASSEITPLLGMARTAPYLQCFVYSDHVEIERSYGEVRFSKRVEVTLSPLGPVIEKAFQEKRDPLSSEHFAIRENGERFFLNASEASGQALVKTLTSLCEVRANPQ
jgi:hypothetical protein